MATNRAEARADGAARPEPKKREPKIVRRLSQKTSWLEEPRRARRLEAWSSSRRGLMRAGASFERRCFASVLEPWVGWELGSEGKSALSPFVRGRSWLSARAQFVLVEQ
jgi:hypothetical protein